jgi:beta-galactosidase
MRKLFIFLFFILFIKLTITASVTFDGNQRQTYNFNADWKLKVGDFKGAENPSFDDHDWKMVTLPRAFNEDEAFRVSIEQLTDTVMWYRKHFKLFDSDKGKKIFIEFEGVRQAAQVYINGHYLGLHENGITAFGFDITNDVVFGKENVISVRVDNSWKYREQATKSTFQWNDNNFNVNYGGIHKNVFLYATPKVYQTLPLWSFLKSTGVYIYGSGYDIKNHSAVIHAESQICNATSEVQNAAFEVVVEDMDGKEIARFTGNTTKIKPNDTLTLYASQKVNDLHFWSWGYGYLYNVYTIVKLNDKPVDVVKTRTGFRKTEFKNGMVYLNDRVIQMKGYAQRTSNEWPAVGNCVPAWMTDYSNGLAVEGNANLFRWMHIAPWRQDVLSCDRVGLMQMLPAGDSEKDVDDRRWGQRTEVMHDVIIYYRNNPSVVILESGNKGISEEHMAQMKAIRDKFDPHGGRAIGAREMLDNKIAEYGGEMLYINKSAHIPMIAAEYCRDEAIRKYWDEQTPPYHKDGAGPLHKGADASEYNRNQDTYAVEIVKRWFDYFRERPGTGTRVSSGGVNIVFSETNTHHRGEENYRHSGEVDAMRIPKDAFYAHQVMWDGWVDPEKTHTYIVGHWNYSDTVKKNVYVISPAEKIELFLNGQSLGYGTRDYYFLHTFNQVAWKKGTLKAVSYDNKGNELSSYEINTTEKPAAIRLSIIKGPQSIKADGADMVLAQVEIVDANGHRVPDVHIPVTFKLDGPAEWRGGIAQGPDNYILSKTLPAECGINRAIIRTTTTSGKITLTATAEGLKPATVSFETVPVNVTDGLSTDLPDAGLPSILSRGETPQNPSYTVSRKAIEVKSVKAGANEDKANLSFDDNETTEWDNDGKLATGWITYKLVRRADISEVCLKMSGWRSKSYPVEILVNGREAWKGTTPQSLGYVTLQFNPVQGDEVTIRLTGANIEKDAYNNMIEVSGKKEKDAAESSEKTNSKAQLKIVEAEFYEHIE